MSDGRRPMFGGRQNAQPAREQNGPVFGRRTNRTSLEDDAGPEAPDLEQHRVVEPHRLTTEQAPLFQRQSSGGDQPPVHPPRVNRRRQEDPVSHSPMRRPDRPYSRSDPRNHGHNHSPRTPERKNHPRLTLSAPQTSPDIVAGHVRGYSYDSAGHSPKNYNSRPGGWTPFKHRRAHTHDTPTTEPSIATFGSSNDFDETVLASYMPDAWSCPPDNAAGVMQDSVRLRKISHVSAMIVANKPIPTPYLKQVGARRSSQSRIDTMSGGLARRQTEADHSLDPPFSGRQDGEEPADMRRHLTHPHADNASSSMVYYFEVTLKRDSTVWIGLVPTSKSLETNSSLTHPYKVSLNTVPGYSAGSIGLSSDGTLLVAGDVVDGGLGAFGRFQKEDTLGCGIEILGLRRVFFTKNGKLLGSPRDYPGLSVEDNMFLPAVALTEGSVDVVANFGLGSQPLKWNGGDRLRLIFPTDAVPDSMEEAVATSSQESVPAKPVPRPMVPIQPYNSGLERQSKPQSRPGVVHEHGPPPTKREDTSYNRLDFLDPSEIEKARSQAQELQRICTGGDTGILRVEELLRICQATKKQVDTAVRKLCSFEADPKEVNEALDLNEEVSDAVNTGENYLKSKRKSPDEEGRGKSPPDEEDNRDTGISTEVDALARKKDIFSLICMLRAHDGEKRLDAALWLMSFAMGVEGEVHNEAMRLKAEIRSTGGMPSLLTLFRTKSTPHELKVVSAMAVAHLSPSFISNNEFSSLSSGGVGLKIIDCLRFLSTADPVSPRGKEISVEDMCNAATMAAADFWMNALVPILSKSEVTYADTPGGGDELIERPSYSLSSRPQGRHVQVGFGGRFVEERQETLEVQELMEMMVSLIVHLCKIETSPNQQNSSSADLVSRYTLVEAVCGVESARPIAVREGLLRILVAWLKNRDKIGPAATSLRYLTSTQDKYMAGWIHSQIVSEEALSEIVRLLGDPYVKNDVRLAVAEILSNLCVAPHTRAALVNANCTTPLTHLLWEYTEPASRQIVLAAASTLIQLAAGAIARSGVYRGDNMDLNDAASSDKRDDIIDGIIQGGALDQFLSIAGTQKRGKLRLTSIEALRVISEDVNPSRRVRSTLCKEGAAKVLGHVLTEDVNELCRVLKLGCPDLAISTHRNGVATIKEGASHESLLELYHALCTLANILEPAQSDLGVVQSFEYGAPRSGDTQDALLKGCIETAESGGLRSLLVIASSTCESFSFDDSDSKTKAEFLIESCRCLASLSSLLLSEQVADEGFAGWACDVLEALTIVLKRTARSDGQKKNTDLAHELQFDALRGIGSLAEFEPLKLMIVDDSLEFLLRAKDSAGDRTDVSNVASQVCQSLGFTEDEIAVQVAGNDPKLLADWFCLQRSLVIQAMAREEIRRTLTAIWRDHVLELRRKGVLPAKLSRESSGHSSETSGQGGSDDKSNESKGDTNPIHDLFESLDDDNASAELRHGILKCYGDLFERGNQHKEALSCGLSASAQNGGIDAESFGLLSRHVYPLSKVSTEKEWILDHGKSMRKGTKETGLSHPSTHPLGSHIQKLLDCCFPSRLLQKQILPICDLNGDASFNFSALLMPQRRYFSFRREGEMVSRLCEKHAASTISEDVHWTLGFTNSSFAGEFTETLVQALYRCPIVQGISFARNSDWDTIVAADDQEDEGEDGSALLAELFGSLPPWISSLTFDSILGPKFVKALIEILEMMGQLSAGAEHESQGNSSPIPPDSAENSPIGQRQGSFRCLALRNSPNIGADAFIPFFSLLGSSQARPQESPSKPALSQLQSLDLSGNNLGDEACARLLDLVHKRNSGSLLADLDISKNNIRKGLQIRKVLRNYIQAYRDNQWTGLELGKNDWCSPLNTLNLASNQLCEGGLARHLITFLKGSSLSLKSLDLSDNGLRDDRYDQFSDVFCGSLSKNTTLLELDLSGNKFSSTFLDQTLELLSQSESHAGVPFLRFDHNVPSLSVDQRERLDGFVSRSRLVALERFVHEKERTKARVIEGDGATASKSVGGLIQDRELSPIMEQGGQRNSAKWSIGEDTENFSVASQSSLGTGSVSTRNSRRQRQSSHANMITVLFSAPLVFRARPNGELLPFLKLDFKMERELMWQCLKEACRDIELSFDNATTDRLLATMTKRCACLHYSGHGHERYLPLENEKGNGGTHWLEVDILRDMLSRGTKEGGAPFKFVFVSACFSYLAGETFASAGVEHVVCCQQNSELKDASALTFTRQFYLSLAVGRTVKDSFEQGCHAVRLSPIKDPDAEMKKFVLLPRDGNHDVPVFDARPLLEWPPSGSALNLGSKSKRGRGLSRSRSVNFRGARNSELSVRNMMQEDPSPTPPQFFLGREVDMHQVLNHILQKRLVSVVGPAGYGSSSLACGLCHYINERRSTIQGIEVMFFVKAKRSRINDRSVSLITPFLKKLEEGGRLKPLEPGVDMEAVFDKIFKCLKSTKALVVFDRIELLEGSEEAQDFPLFLSGLFQETEHVKVLLTGRKSLGIPAFGGVVDQPYNLGPLNFANTVRLFAQLCPHLHTLSERAEIFKALVTDGHQASLCPGNVDVDDRTAELFERLGNGVPSEIEKAAYGMLKEDLNVLRNYAAAETGPQIPSDDVDTEEF